MERVRNNSAETEDTRGLTHANYRHGASQPNRSRGSIRFPKDIRLVQGRTLAYNVMDESLNSAGATYPTSFFQAAAQVTGLGGLSTGQFLGWATGWPIQKANESTLNEFGIGLYRDVNRPLYDALHIGDAGFKLADGSALGDYAGRPVRDLDYALVHNEQSYIQRRLDALSPTQRDRLIADSNRAILLSPNLTVQGILNGLDHEFDFRSQADREAIGRGLTDRYRREREYHDQQNKLNRERPLK